MDTMDKPHSSNKDGYSEDHSNLQHTSIEGEIENNPNASEINESIQKPCEAIESNEKCVETSVIQKESIEILSVELVSTGNEHIENQRKNEDSNVDNNMETNAVMDVAETILDEILDSSNKKQENQKDISNEIFQTEEEKHEAEIIINKDLETPNIKQENQEDVTNEIFTTEENDTNIDVNMETNIETTETTENLSIPSSTFTSITENITAAEFETASKNTDSLVSNLTPLAPTPPSGLSLLAQYDSDNDDQISDTDSVIEVPTTSAKDYRNQVVEINSDSDSDDSDSDSGVEYLNEIRKTIEKRIEVASDDDEDDDEDNEEGANKKKYKQKLKVKGEMSLEDLPPIQDLQISVAEAECIEFGKIHSIVDQLVLVSALPNAILLDLETVIFLEKGQKVLGEVFDVLGQVADPLYCIRFNSNKQIKEKEITVGDVVYVAPKTQYTQYVILSSLMKLKGSDASWLDDVEPPPRFLDYSDDEQQQMAKRQLRKKEDRPIDNEDAQKRSRYSEGSEQGNSTPRPVNTHHKNRYRYSQQQRTEREPNQSGEHQNSYSRPRYNAAQTQNHPQQRQHQQQQQQPNYHRNSWHSNYYPQQYQGPPPPTQNYGYGSNRAQQQNQLPPSPQAYPSQVPMYPMPPMHAMPYPPPTGHYGSQGRPPMPPQHLMSNSFSIRPPTLYGGPPQQQQYTSPPPPPGLQ